MTKRSKKVSQKQRIIRISIVFVIIIAVYTISFLLMAAAQKSLQSESEALDRRITMLQQSSTQEVFRRQKVTIELPGAKPFDALIDDYSQPDSIWVLVNKSNSIPIDYTPTIVVPDVEKRADKAISEVSVREDIAEPLEALFEAAKAENHNLLLGSAYRSGATQKLYFDNSAASVGETEANKLIAYPGESEHQTGLAVDLSSVSRNCYITECFTDTPDGQWLAQNSYKYGFILRYPADKTAITEYSFEPWHFRYVGIDLATALYESGLTLEEAQPYLQEAAAKLKERGQI